LWFVGILHRGLWTPDEPREADIAWQMTQQSDRTLPQLAGTAFLEKPPLSYWLAATAIEAFGESPGAARAPNILYAIIAALCVGALGYAMGGTAVAFLSALFAGSALIAFRVMVWLAPDACLLAGCAVALLGAYAGYRAAPGRKKLLGYTLLHVGAAIGFMAKSAPGWLVPALALATIIAWERRWSELRRWELYAGFILQALIIGPWVYAVALTADGRDALLAFFWHNIVGRFTKVAGPAALDYTTGHRNSPGKYFLELPVYLFPWTLLAVAAVRRGWTRIRIPGADGTPWRFAVAAALPFLVILSLAATARDIYAAPAMLGLSVLIALWAKEAQGNPGQLDRFALTGTRVLVAAFAFVLIGFVALVATQDSPIGLKITLPVGIAAIGTIALLAAGKAQRRGDVQRSLVCTYGAYTAMLCLAAAVAFPTVDEWQNLPLVAEAIHRDSRDMSLGLLDPDETTIAILDDDLLTPASILTTQNGNTQTLVTEWIRSHGSRARVLVDLPGHAAGPVTRLIARYVTVKPPGDGIAATLTANGAARILRRYELPQGRRYVLLGPP
jgi:4-amino-4-deoxy-L-arabinose transferase-like glycosyltransferase